jgi:hypothetical protein
MTSNCLERSRDTREFPSLARQTPRYSGLSEPTYCYGDEPSRASPARKPETEGNPFEMCSYQSAAARARRAFCPADICSNSGSRGPSGIRVRIKYAYFIDSGPASVLNDVTDGKTVEVGLSGSEGCTASPICCRASNQRRADYLSD